MWPIRIVPCSSNRLTLSWDWRIISLIGSSVSANLQRTIFWGLFNKLCNLWTFLFYSFVPWNYCNKVSIAMCSLSRFSIYLSFNILIFWLRYLKRQIKSGSLFFMRSSSNWDSKANLIGLNSLNSSRVTLNFFLYSLKPSR